MLIRTTAICFALLLASCTSAGYMAPYGSLYMDVTLNKDVTTPSRLGSREGTVCATGYLGLISKGDASIKAAAAVGGIMEVKAVDYRVSQTLGTVIVETCTIARGD